MVFIQMFLLSEIVEATHQHLLIYVNIFKELYYFTYFPSYDMGSEYAVILYEKHQYNLSFVQTIIDHNQMEQYIYLVLLMCPKLKQFKL